MDNPVLCIIGTRPEAIKCSPLIQTLKEQDTPVFVCNTGQHPDLVQPILDIFSIHCDSTLSTFSHGQSIQLLLSRLLQQFDPLFKHLKPKLCIVQGDTTSALGGALAAAYNHCPIAHIEAGLRSFDKEAPFPEEINRVQIDHLSDLLFAPTDLAISHLKQEGLAGKSLVVGNTALDALAFTRKQPPPQLTVYHPHKKNILVTLHRREHHASILKEICDGLKHIAYECPDTQFILPLHPSNKAFLSEELAHASAFTLTEPLPYPDLIHLLSQCYAVFTDSGGIQEEAPALGVPCLVLREKTERLEGIHAGVAKCIGITKEAVIREGLALIQNTPTYTSMARVCYPYGEPGASKKITAEIKARF